MNAIVGKRRGSKRGPEPVIRNTAEAAAYVVFWCGNVWGDKGPFIVLKSKDDAIDRLDLTDDPHFDSKDALADITMPVATDSSGKAAFFNVVAWVLYGNDI